MMGEKDVTFGFFGFSDWLKSVACSFPAPWKIHTLGGKYYGTQIEDARGVKVFSVWLSFGEPSARQRGDMTDEEWREYCCDSHWESRAALAVSDALCACRNALDDKYGDDEQLKLFIALLSFGEWSEDVWECVRARGPEQRALPSDPEIRKSLPWVGR